VSSILARGEKAPGLRASGFETRAGRDVNEVSVRFVLLVFERRQVVFLSGWSPDWMQGVQRSANEVTRYFGWQSHPADGGEGPSLVGLDVPDSSSAVRGEGGTNLSMPCAEMRENQPNRNHWS